MVCAATAKLSPWSPACNSGIVEGDKSMTIDRAVMIFAGFMILLSLALGYYVSPYWYLLTAFVGLNLIQASLTGFCPAAMVFKKLGCKSGNIFR